MLIGTETTAISMFCPLGFPSTLAFAAYVIVVGGVPSGLFAQGERTGEGESGGGRGLPKFDQGTPCLLIEPSLMGHKIARPIPGATKTVLVPGRIGNFGVEVTPAGAFDELGLEWPEFLKKARATSQVLLEHLSPEVTRDEDGFVRSAVIRSKSDLTASILFAPGFLKRFEKSMGDKLLVAAPDRNTLFVFPRTMGTFREFGKEVVARYEDATYPCSIELFEVTSDGVRVVGSFRAD